MSNKVELLSPAGNKEAYYGAVHAGADAIYLGGEKYGARAYADNFTEEQLTQIINIAHLRDVSVYLTLNTLISSEEYSELESVLNPLAESGLDGVIVQDLGVAKLIMSRYPSLEVHASTQMSVMSSYGASMLKDAGFVRVVPSRELTLEEIRQIKEDTGIELECFIHGAMCYSYSGLCLMSSMIGGRSGNRGRCAGTCRLPFTTYINEFESDEEYPLSMKDMCTVEILPKLMDCGIDSYKIEGRMKSPEYVAGVTSIYRKYMDAYIESGSEGYHVDKSDLIHLRNLYIRTEISKGYYEGYKGRNLITLDSPGYNGNDDKYVERLNAKYVHKPDPLEIGVSVYAHAGAPLGITMNWGDIYVYNEGPVCQVAQKAPLSEDKLREQVSKFGGTSFVARDIYVDASRDVFLPMGLINECRRNAIVCLESEILKYYGRK